MPSNCVCIAELTPSKYPTSVDVTADTDTSPLPSETNALDAVKSAILESAIAALALTSAFTITPLPIAAVPVVPIEISPDITTGLKFVPSAIRAAPLVFVPIVRSSPVIVRSPPIVALPVVVSVPVVSVVADKSGILAAILASVTDTVVLDWTIGNKAALVGVVIADNSEIFLVAIYCIVQVVEGSVVSCQSPVDISVESSCCIG